VTNSACFSGARDLLELQKYFAEILFFFLRKTQSYGIFKHPYKERTPKFVRFYAQIASRAESANNKPSQFQGVVRLR
jgi:hypothetical protein